MSLDPRYLQSLPDSLVEMYALAEADILKDMARRIAAYDYFIPSAQHQLQKLTELGGVQKDIIKTLSSMTGKTQGEIVALLTEAGAASIADDTEYYKAAQVYAPNKIDKEALYAQLNAGLLQTQQAFKNITGTTANTAAKQFENALDRAWTQINVGGFDYNTAIRGAVKSLSEGGVGAVRYKSGRVDSIEVAVRRAVVTGANQTAAKTQEVLADELSVDLVEVTAHSGARPSHAVWQGKCYSRSGRKTVDGVTYEDLRTATGYGSGAGLCGWNCRHNMHPYVPGAPRTWTDAQLRRLDEKSIAYNGEKYSEYEASQIQRGIEREIRKQKRTVAALEAAGQDASAEKAKLRTAQRAYSDFTAQTGLKKQPARAQVGINLKTSTPDGKLSIEKITKSDILKEELAQASSIFANKNEKLFRYAQKIEPESGFDDIVVHSDSNNFEIDLVGSGNESDFVALTPAQMAERILNSRGYHGGDIRLIACKSGAEENGAAQRIANALNCRVKAPTENVNIDSKGRMFLSDNEVLAQMWNFASDEEKSKFKETGKWLVFNPQNK